MGPHPPTLAVPHARAGLWLAGEKGRRAPFSQQLGFTAIAVEQPAVSSVLGDPRVAASDLVDVLLPPDADPVFRQFLVVLGESRRLPLLPEIAGLFDELRAKEEKVVKATITSAQVLDAAQLATLTESLRKRFGSEVEVSTAVDAALIGGAVIDAGDVVIDGSIRTKLARLGAALAN